jgi:3'(2'), 5'-bisphosphate nucleotidase
MIGDHALASSLADAAGRLLLEIRRKPPAGAALGAEGDRASHRFLVDAIRHHHPADAILSEGAADDARRLTADRVWIIDPLDGTREFGEDGREDWTVHLALWQRGALAAGAVALPARAIALSTASHVPTPPAVPGSRLRFLVSRTRPPDVATAAAQAVGAELVPMGSAGAKTLAVVLGRAPAVPGDAGGIDADAARDRRREGPGRHHTRTNGARLLGVNVNYLEPSAERLLFLSMNAITFKNIPITVRVNALRADPSIPTFWSPSRPLFMRM